MSYWRIGLMLVLCAALPIDALAQGPNDIQLEQSVYFTGADGETVQVMVGQYSITEPESDVLMLVGESVTHRVRGMPYDYGEKLYLANVVSFDQGENEHHILLLRPDGTGLVAVGSYSDVATRAARQRVSIQTKFYRTNVKQALNQRWTKLATRVRVQQRPQRTFAVRPPPQVKAIVDNTFTVTNDATGGECGAMGQGVIWNSSSGECIISAYTLDAEKTLHIKPGATVRVTGDFRSHGKITNEGLLNIGDHPPLGDPITEDKLFAAKVTNYGLIENRAEARAQCFTRAAWANEKYTPNANANAYGGNVVNDGLLVVDCLFVHRGKELLNNGKIILRWGTNRRVAPSDQMKNFFGLVINRLEIRQGAMIGVQNYSTVENYGTYVFADGYVRDRQLHQGAYLTNMYFDSHFYNICVGTSPGLDIRTRTVRNPASYSYGRDNPDVPRFIDTPGIETKPCDADNDGIPDSQDQCPNDPEIVNGLLDSDGCPDASMSYP